MKDKKNDGPSCLFFALEQKNSLRSVRFAHSYKRLSAPYVKDRYMGKAENIKEYYRNKYLKEQKILVATQKRGHRYLSQDFRIWENIVSRISQEIPEGCRKRPIKELIGCDAKFLAEYLSKQFDEGMTLENYPKWEPDHIKPIASFDLTSDSKQVDCFHFTNLQPLWMTANRSKGKRTQ